MRGITRSNDILVGDDNSFGGTGCSRCIHDTGQVVWFWRSGFAGVLFPGLEEVIVSDDCEVVMGFLQCINVFLGDFILVDDILPCQRLLRGIYFNILGLGERFDDRLDEVTVQEDGDGVRLLQGVSKALLSERVIGSNNRN
jgi:hypothetical protein